MKEYPYPQLLRILGLPVFSSMKELSSAIHIDLAHIKLFSRYSDSGYYYYEYTIPKKSGGERIIRQPGRRLKAIQAWILRNILDKLQSSRHATAFQKRKCLKDNVTPHRYNRYFLCIDLEDFYHSIKTYRVKMLFELIGYPASAASVLGYLCTCKNALPQGGITSPSLSNLICGKLDKRLSSYTSRRNIVYTRYADDMTFSSNNPKKLQRAYPMLIKIIKTSNFQINYDKVRFFGPRRRCLITGLVKNSTETSFGIGRKKKRIMRAVMHNLLIKKGTDSKYDNVLSIKGWLSYLNSVDTDSYKQMNAYYNRLKRKIKSS
jgi:RNA-directed DNA polymerase